MEVIKRKFFGGEPSKDKSKPDSEDTDLEVSRSVLLLYLTDEGFSEDHSKLLASYLLDKGLPLHKRLLAMRRIVELYRTMELHANNDNVGVFLRNSGGIETYQIDS